MTPGGSSSGCRMRSIRSSARSSMRCFSPFAASMIERMRSFAALLSTPNALRAAVRALARARAVVRRLALDAERLEVDRGELEPAQHLAREHGALRHRLLDRAGAERQ